MAAVYCENEGKKRIDEALAKFGHKMGSDTKDKEAVALCNLLRVPREQLPTGFTKQTI